MGLLGNVDQATTTGFTQFTNFGEYNSNASTTTLAAMNMTYSSGVFTYTGASRVVVNVDYHISCDWNSNGVRLAAIEAPFAWIAGMTTSGMSHSNQWTGLHYLSGSSMIVLNSNDSFKVRFAQSSGSTLNIKSSSSWLSLSM
jgi:hypothetical protein